jgi:hypothetical protein
VGVVPRDDEHRVDRGVLEDRVGVGGHGLEPELSLGVDPGE